MNNLSFINSKQVFYDTVVALFNLPIAAPGCGGALVEASTVLTGATGLVWRVCWEVRGAAVRCTWLRAGGVSCVASARQRPAPAQLSALHR